MKLYYINGKGNERMNWVEKYFSTYELAEKYNEVVHDGDKDIIEQDVVEDQFELECCSEYEEACKRKDITMEF